MPTQPAVSACETHLSRLFFAPDRVYKLLKPVTLPFVDFSSTDARCAAATEEFERNHAISPDVYLGVADVVEDGALVDRMIVMRRLDAADELTQRLGDGTNTELIRRVARHVAGMHANLAPLEGAAAAPASPTAIASNWEDNLRTIRPQVGAVIEPDDYDEVAELARSFMAGREGLFRSRIDDGWVRDGHGDLRAEHIYVTPDGPRVIDCVAFDDALRISDVLADVAFLAMDLDRLSGAAAAVCLMNAWNEFTNEHHPSSLAHFYVAYRAHVRCKIACLRLANGDGEAEKDVRTYHNLALRHLRLARIRVVLVGGGPGTGKSTIAEGVAKHLGAVWLRADEIRKDIAGLGHDEHAFAAPGEGIYSPEVTAKVQAELIRETELLVSQGVSVVLDATWRSAREREVLRQVAARSAAQIDELCCELSPAIAKERIARRMASVYNPSDATPELVDYFADRFDEWTEAAAVDTTGSPAESIAGACRLISPGSEPDPVPEADPAPGAPGARFVVDLAVLRNAILIDGGIRRDTRSSGRS